MINNFLEVFLNPSFYTYVYISFPVIVDFDIQFEPTSYLFLLEGDKSKETSGVGANTCTGGH